MLTVLKVPTTVVTCLQLLPSVLITGNVNGDIHVWSMKDYSALRKIQAHEGPIVSMQCYRSYIVTAGSDGVKEWNYSTEELVRELSDSECVWQVGSSEKWLFAALVRDSKLVLDVRSP